ncbi:hypothetical protein BC567DRAFT_219099 [Phyllosticta citribraziliensis]
MDGWMALGCWRMFAAWPRACVVTDCVCLPRVAGYASEEREQEQARASKYFTFLKSPLFLKSTCQTAIGNHDGRIPRACECKQAARRPGQSHSNKLLNWTCAQIGLLCMYVCVYAIEERAGARDARSRAGRSGAERRSQGNVLRKVARACCGGVGEAWTYGVTSLLKLGQGLCGASGVDYCRAGGPGFPARHDTRYRRAP